MKKCSSFGKSNNSHKGKAAANTFDSKKKSKRIQCCKCEGFGHIQFECANTLRKGVNHLLSLGVMRNLKVARSMMKMK